MHTACWFTYFERCDLIAPLLEINGFSYCRDKKFNNSVSSQIPAPLTRVLTQVLTSQSYFTALNYADLSLTSTQAVMELCIGSRPPPLEV